MTHENKITPATSPLLCNHPAKHNTAANINAIFDLLILICSGPHGQRENATSLIFVQQTRHAQVATVNGWRPLLRRRRTSPVERSARVRHLSDYTSDLQETVENTV